MAIKSQIFKKIFDKNQNALKSLNDKFNQFLEKKHFCKPNDENSKQYIEYAILLERFLIQFLNLDIKTQASQIDEIYSIRRYIEKTFKNIQNFEKIEITTYQDEYDFAQKISRNKKFDLDDEKYILNILNDEVHKEYRRNSLLFSLPKQYEDFKKIIDFETNIHDLTCNDFDFHFEKNKTQSHAEMNIKYCLKCHERKKDFCRKGIEESQNNYKISPLENILHGCPLDEKISEAILLKENGFLIASLAMMMVNNPLLAMTGYRICNDCAKSCIFQKQTPVDVPLIETHILNEILQLPFGAEIYILLTQWNPLNLKFPSPIQKNNKNILVIGLGPAGIAMSYYLLRHGFNVVTLEATKILPLKRKYSLIKNWNQYCKSLEVREIEGFGGVMEYGITSRWNKNFLKLMRLTLERNKNFHYFDGVRFGSNYKIENAKKIFHHIVIATGAGNQKIPIKVENILAKNIRLAADFLMTLQLNGAYKKNEKYNAVNLQIKLPAIVIGGGLTAIDTATEILNYYPRQLLKIYNFYDNLSSKDIFEESLNENEKKDLEEFLRQAKILKNLKSQSEIYQFLNEELGGVTIIYHKNLHEASSYKTNHEEMESALRKCIKFLENIEIKRIIIDKNDAIEMIEFCCGNKIDAKSLFIAYGFDLNSIVLKESGISEDEIKNFLNLGQNFDIKKSQSSMIVENISVIGDMNPQYKGSVVKAIANGYQGANEIFQRFLDKKYNEEKTLNIKKFKKQFIVNIYSIRKMNNELYEIAIKNEQLSKSIQIGEFAKFQNYNDDILEPIALTPIFIDEKKHIIHFVFKICGASTYFLSKLKKGERILFISSLGGKFDEVETIFYKKILFICDDVYQYFYIPLLQKLFEQNNKISYMTKNIRKMDNFYKNKILKFINDFKETDCISNEILNDFDFIVLGSHNFSLQNKKNFENKIIEIRKSSMQCMMKGVCSRCVEKKNDEYFYNCAMPIYKIYDGKMEEIDRTRQNSLMEKLSFASERN